MSLLVRLDVLKRMSSKLHADASRYASHAPPTFPCTMPSMELALALPEPLTPRLTALGLDEPSAVKISSAILGTISRLKNHFEADLLHRSQALRPLARYFQGERPASLFPRAYTKIYAKSVQSLTSYILDVYTPRVLRARLRRHTPGGRGEASQKRPFNQKAVPILERFFNDNAFPSRLDKLELASACRMDYRQIHVWFQNRRSRCRKDGRELKKREQNDPLLRDLESTVLETLLPPSSEEEEVDEVEPEFTERSSSSSLCSHLELEADAPPHAFPSPYPPLCSYNPFPMSPEERALPAPWIRRPQSHRQRSQTTDLADLVESFKRLAVVDSHDGQQASSSQHSPPSTAQQSSPAVGFATSCPLAPHPALLPQSPTPTVHAPTLHPASRRGHHDVLGRLVRDRLEGGLRKQPVFGECTPPVVASLHQSPEARRVKRTLPRRLPRNAPSNWRACLNSTSFFGHPYPPHRTMRRSTSTSSTASDAPSPEPDSPLRTPPQLCLPLGEGTSPEFSLYQKTLNAATLQFSQSPTDFTSFSSFDFDPSYTLAPFA